MGASFQRLGAALEFGEGGGRANHDPDDFDTLYRRGMYTVCTPLARVIYAFGMASAWLWPACATFVLTIASRFQLLSALV
jgi:hypothetical protein